MLYKNECFVCGTEHMGNKCPNCGYEFSLTMDCPYLGFGGICDETHKFCKFRNEDHLKCETWLKKQD